MNNALDNVCSNVPDSVPDNVSDIAPSTQSSVPDIVPGAQCGVTDNVLDAHCGMADNVPGDVSDNVFEVSALRKSFGDFTIKDLSITLPKGYIMGFMGPSGAGKTITIKMILGIIKSEAGSVTLFGSSATSEPSEAGEKIGVVLDEPLCVGDWTMRDVQKSLQPFYRQWDSAVYDRYLKQFGIDQKKQVRELSRGMKVKLQIAVALSHNAKLLVLDEATSGLDPVARDEIALGRNPTLHSTVSEQSVLH